MKKYRGVANMLEMLLVLAVAAVLIMLAAKRYKAYEQASDTAIMKQTIATLIRTFDLYYFQNCQQGNLVNATFTPAQLGLVGSNLPPNPYGATTYQFGIYDTKQANLPYYLRQLYVQIPLDQKYTSPQDHTLYFKNLLNATDIKFNGANGQYWLEWTFVPVAPNQVAQDAQSPDWVLQLNARRYLLQAEPTNPCWFPPVTPSGGAS